jgi:hypothetical protein
MLFVCHGKFPRHRVSVTLSVLGVKAGGVYHRPLNVNFPLLRYPLPQLLPDDPQSGFKFMNCQRATQPRISPIANRTSATGERRDQGNDVT